MNQKKQHNKQNRILIFSLGISFLLFFVYTIFNRSKPEMSAKTIQARLDFLAEKEIKNLDLVPFDSLHIPRSAKKDGTIKSTPSKSWTSGFYPGVLWHLYGGDAQKNALKKAAIQWQTPVEKEKKDTTTHDLGFKVFCSFGNAWRYTHNASYKEVCVDAARSLSTRFNPKVGAIRSWDHHEDLWKYPVIIDNMMNLELLFEATRFTGDSTFYYVANQHALTTLENHFRKDNSSYHVVDYDPETGAVVKRNTHQGFNHESAWSRGQAWGLYGFAVAYRYTHNKKFLAQAKKIATFIFNHPNLPEDYIPYWDFDAPNIPNEPRDVSAATVAVSGLLELAMYDKGNQNKYFKWADHVFASLEKSDYQSVTPPFILRHSVGSVPGKFEIDVPIIYADYYYVEALQRRLNFYYFD